LYLVGSYSIQEKSPKAALTELFLELKTDQTRAVVERIVSDIDASVINPVLFIFNQEAIPRTCLLQAGD